MDFDTLAERLADNADKAFDLMAALAAWVDPAELAGGDMGTSDHAAVLPFLRQVVAALEAQE